MKNMNFSATDDTTAMVFGPHIMRGSTRGGPNTVINGIGDVDVKNSYFENMSDGPVIMWFHSSRIVVKDNVTKNVGRPIYLEGFVNSKAEVKNNVFMDSNRGVALLGTPHTTIKDNQFLGVDAQGKWFLAAIAIYYGSTDVTIKGNGFYDVANVDTDGAAPDGAGAVLIWQGGGGTNGDINIKNNDYDDMEVAIRTYVNDVWVCEKDLDPSQVVGTLNSCN